MAISVNSVSAATNGSTFVDNASANNNTIPANYSSKITTRNEFEGASPSNGDYELLISDVKVNGKEAPIILPTIHQGDKLMVEAELTGPFPGWRHLNFYLIKFGQTIWQDTVLTNLFTGKASVTIDSNKMKLTPDEYSLEVIWSDTSNAVLFHIVPNASASSGDENESNDNTQTTKESANTGTTGMQNTGTPITPLILAVLTIMGFLTSTRKK